MKVYFTARTTAKDDDSYLIIITVYINQHNVTILMFMHLVTEALHQRPEKEKVQNCITVRDMKISLKTSSKVEKRDNILPSHWGKPHCPCRQITYIKKPYHDGKLNDSQF